MKTTEELWLQLVALQRIHEEIINNEYNSIYYDKHRKINTSNRSDKK